MASKNPKWHRDEIILALDLYFNLRDHPGQIHHNHPEIIKLSEVLNVLPIHKVRPDAEKFRNPNGVGLKLSNFLALDPDYAGKGMERYSKLDKEVFQEFQNDQRTLHIIAEQIRKVAKNEKYLRTLYGIPNEQEEGLSMVREGRVLYKVHCERERNSKIIKRKKEKVLDETGRLECEVCTFDFEQYFGRIGRGYIEAHHKIPLAMTDFERKTHLDDLALVCPNCHRMLHRDLAKISMADLRKILVERDWPLFMR